MRTLNFPFVSKAIGVLRFLYLKGRFFNCISSVGLSMAGRRNRFYLRGKLKLGYKVIFSEDNFIDVKGNLTIGSNCFFNDYCRIVCHEKIEIGNHVTVAANVSFFDHDHNYHYLEGELRLDGFSTAPIVIGDNVWIGEKVIILKGVSIGKNAIIAAGAIVNKDIPENSIAGGIPAKKIKSLR